MNDSSPKPSSAVMRCGTEEPPSPTQVVEAGPLQVMLDAGNLRYVQIGGREALRAAAFIARTDAWGTYVPQINDLEIEQTPERFTISYSAVCKDDSQELHYRARIEGEASGTLSFDVELNPVTDWLTNRTGFSVLHNVEGVAGYPVDVVHTDGSEEQLEFPALIKPSQPVFDIRSLAHEAVPGTRVTCVMEGEAYEMEDQRNWTDASYKTYFRPLSKRPLPYVLPAGEKSTQRVALTITGELGSAAASDAAVRVRLTGDRAGALPALGLAVTAENTRPALSVSDRLTAVRPGFLVCHFNPKAGHGSAEMARFAELGRALQAPLWLEAVLPCQDSSGEYSNDEGLLQADVDALAAAAAGIDFAAVIPSPLAYHKSYQPDGVWPDVPPLETVYQRVRERFPGARLGGGMHSYFTELNRKRPPAAAIDFITHTTCPIVHAGDDVTVMESLEALPSVMQSAHALAPGKDYCIGPSSIGMRFNPYGVEPVPNPHNGRVPMARVDPRQRGLLNAAWVLGYIAHAARHEVQALTLAAPVGEHGIVYTGSDWQQPWYDDRDDAVVYPCYHVLSGIGNERGATVLATDSSAPGVVQSLALRNDRTVQLWLANLTAEEQGVNLEGAAPGRITMIDESTFLELCTNPAALGQAGDAVTASTLSLAPYAVARVECIL